LNMRTESDDFFPDFFLESYDYCYGKNHYRHPDGYIDGSDAYGWRRNIPAFSSVFVYAFGDKKFGGHFLRIMNYEL